jgi:inner membrane protein
MSVLRNIQSKELFTMNDTPVAPEKTGAKPASEPNFFNRIFSALPSSLLARCGLITAIILALHIPLIMVKSVINEREYLHRTARNEIAGSWGKSQIISGPALIIPYEVWEDRTEAVKEFATIMIDDIPRKVEKTNHVVRRYYLQREKIILPAEVDFNAGLETEIRYRGIHRQVVYSAPVAVRGVFTLPDASAFEPNLHKIHWEKAWLAVGIADPRAILETVPLMWGDGPSRRNCAALCGRP